MPNITEAQANALRVARDIPSERDRKRRKAAIFAEIKSTLRIPNTQKIKMEIDNKTSPWYCALKDGDTSLLLEPASAAYSGAREIVSLSTAKVEEAKYPFPGAEKAQAGSAAAPQRAVASSYDVVAKPTHQLGAQPAMGAPQLKLGSISLDDAVKLLRVEADSQGSYASAENYAENAVFVKGERLYFVL